MPATPPMHPLAGCGRRWLLVGLACALAIQSACTGSAPLSPGAAAASPPLGGPDLPAVLASAAPACDLPPACRDLGEPPHLCRLSLLTPPELAYSPGSTPWHTIDVPGPAQDSFPHADSALSTLLVELGLTFGTWRSQFREFSLRTLPSESDSELALSLLAWGTEDDAVIGREYRALFLLDERGWRVARLEERWHCARGISGSLCI